MIIAALSCAPTLTSHPLGTPHAPHPHHTHACHIAHILHYTRPTHSLTHSPPYPPPPPTHSPRSRLMSVLPALLPCRTSTARPSPSQPARQVDNDTPLTATVIRSPLPPFSRIAVVSFLQAFRCLTQCFQHVEVRLRRVFTIHFHHISRNTYNSVPRENYAYLILTLPEMHLCHSITHFATPP